MIEIAATSLLPLWFTVPLAALTMIGLAGHIIALREAEMPERNRRIRVANGMLMLTVTPLLACVLGFASPNEPRLFLLIWVAVTGLLGMILMLAMMDVSTTMRRHRARLRNVQLDIQALREEFGSRGGRSGGAEGSSSQLKYHPGEPDNDGEDA